MQEEFKEYKKELSKYWDEPVISDKKNWVNYSEDKKTRTKVGFESKEIEIETIASSPEEAQKKLRLALAKSVVTDTVQAEKQDELSQRIKKAIGKIGAVVTEKIKTEQILSNIVFNKPPTTKDVVKYVKDNIDMKKVKVSTTKKAPQEKVYKAVVKLPSDMPIKRSKQYVKEVHKNATRFELSPSLVFAIMETESSFNPRARSHVPAFGLMQIVPRTAGVDSYNFIYKENKAPSPEYLYDGNRNIEMGTAYLHILYYRYLKKIKNPKSRLYCTMAAYNTGSGNIAWAFTKKFNLSKAAPKINAMTPDEVYAHLRRNLRWPEAQNYLKNVNNRMKKYKKVFKES